MDAFIAKVDDMIINPLIGFSLLWRWFIFSMVFLNLFWIKKRREKNFRQKSYALGVVGITIMLGVWTILNMILATLNIPQSQVNPEKGRCNCNKYSPLEGWLACETGWINAKGATRKRVPLLCYVASVISAITLLPAIKYLYASLRSCWIRKENVHSVRLETPLVVHTGWSLRIWPPGVVIVISPPKAKSFQPE